MSLDRLKSGIDYAAIANAYGYKPIPDGFYEIPATPVKIDWKADAHHRDTQQANAMRTFDTRPLLPTDTNPNLKMALLSSATIQTDQGPLVLDCAKYEYKGIELLRLNLQEVGTGTEISQFQTQKEGSKWTISDRITLEVYRGKGIASQMIDTTESCVQAYADSKGEDQFIEMEAAQLPVLSVFLKKGYEVVPQDQKRFAEVMSLLEAGDPKYTLASCNADFREGQSERKNWYVFDRDTYEHFGERIWAIENDAKKPNYMLHSVRFKLRKKIEAKKSGVQDVVNGVRDGVRGL